MKKIKRSSTNRILFGVCGGLGEALEIDPAIFRILFIALGLTRFVGVWLYLLLVLLLPSDGRQSMYFRFFRNQSRNPFDDRNFRTTTKQDQSFWNQETSHRGPIKEAKHVEDDD